MALIAAAEVSTALAGDARGGGCHAIGGGGDGEREEMREGSSVAAGEAAESILM